jgi:hypothetical protein
VRSHPTAGQANIEYIGAIALVALVFILAAPAVGAPSIAGAVVREFKHALCVVGGDICTPQDAARAGLLPCPLRSRITGGEASVTAFSIALGGRATLTVTPQSDGTVLVVRTGQLSAGVELGPSVGWGGGVRFEAGGEGQVRARFQAGRGWVFPDRATANRFLEASLRDELDTRRWPPTWELVESGREAGAWAGTRLAWKDQGGFRPATAAAVLSQALGIKETRDGAVTFYARAALDSAEFTLPGVRPFRTDGRQEWILEYTRKHGKPVELILRTGIASEGAERVEDVAARLDLRDPANLAVARPFLESPGTWLSGGTLGKRAVLDRIATHGIVERWVSTSEDHSRGGSINAKLGIKFSLGGKRIKLVRRLIEASATVGGGLTGKRLDCVPSAAAAA